MQKHGMFAALSVWILAWTVISAEVCAEFGPAAPQVQDPYDKENPQVIDDVVSADVVASLLERVPFQLNEVDEKRDFTVGVPAWLGQVLKALCVGQPLMAPPLQIASDDLVELPARAIRSNVSSHQDQKDGRVAGGRVAILYLQGAGTMMFMPMDRTGRGRTKLIEARPGRIISWNNADFRHSLVAAPGDVRVYLGPVAMADERQMVQVGDDDDEPAPRTPAPTPAPQKCGRVPAKKVEELQLLRCG